MVEGNTLDFNVTVDPAQYADSVTLISENENIAKFQGNTLIPVGEGNVSVKATVQAYGVKIESNSIKVEVQAKPATHTINDDNVPLQIEPIYGADEVGFIFRNFKADFNIRTEAVTPSII
ncbi:MAG: hypothetical protein MJ200_04440 [Mycoplasmoidaceae bacterium]|nr:hypothetical protein [Mycoplasmoidaceae bacterium]